MPNTDMLVQQCALMHVFPKGAERALIGACELIRTNMVYGSTKKVLEPDSIYIDISMFLLHYLGSFWSSSWLSSWHIWSLNKEMAGK